MAGRVLKVLEEQGLLRATGKTIVVFNARPKMKARPISCQARPPAASGWRGAQERAAPVDDEDEDEDDEE